LKQEFYDLSGGMESAAMICLDVERIKKYGHIVRWADTGKHFPEMEASLQQIENCLGIEIVRIAPRISFDEFLFQRGGIIRKGTTDCSRRMKRGNLSAHLKNFERPYTINLGYNCAETQRADEFMDRNERDWLHWRFPLIEHGVSREQTWTICADAGFSILVSMYKKMGRFDCFWCGNQRPSQAALVIKHYPQLAAEWIAAEERKGHSFMRMPLKILKADIEDDGLFAGCSCFGGTECVADEIENES
jgi:3'-phosphoadenosine 5'-phosphosulfate sulfotransferase (PAPS reductase)/FAD synthetase